MGSLVSKCAPCHHSNRRRSSSSSTPLTSPQPRVPVRNSLNNLDAEKARLCVPYHFPPDALGAISGSSTDGKLVYFSKNRMIVTDDNGIQLYYVALMCRPCHLFHTKDICWSSFLNRFLILPNGQPRFLFSVNLTAEINANDIGWDTFTVVHKFEDIRQMACLTCCDDRLMISSYGKGSHIEEYEMRNWTLTKTYEPPISCKPENEIRQLHFNTDGTRLALVCWEADLSVFRDKATGILKRPPPYINYWFELRDSRDPELTVLHRIDDVHRSCRPLLLPLQQQFLLNVSSNDITQSNSKLLLVNSNTGELEETIPYASTYISDTALINEKCLVIDHHNTLFFYDL